jgi:hypothetical protein
MKEPNDVERNGFIFKLFSNNNIHISEGFGYCGEKCDVQSNSPK